MMGKFAKSQRDFDLMDEMPPSLRAVVQEFGFEIVSACRRNGVTDPARIRDLVREIWAGARQPLQGMYRRKQSRALNNLDWVLLQAGAGISAATLIRVLDFNSLQVVPTGAHPIMVEASMSAIDGLPRLTKREKHTIRLRAALAAGRKAVLREHEVTA